MVETDGKFMITNLMNYPNPFMNETTIRAEHNRPDNELDVVIRIYNLNGAAIKLIRTKVQSSGFVIPQIGRASCRERV